MQAVLKGSIGKLLVSLVVVQVEESGDVSGQRLTVLVGLYNPLAGSTYGGRSSEFG